jgi:sugar/nucleoside kinase (ribokinase family)
MNMLLRITGKPWIWSWLAAALVWFATVMVTGGASALGLTQAALTFAAFSVIVGIGQMFVITLGPDGAVAVDADGRTDVPGRKVEVVDTVGAGDTFMAGFLDGFVRRQASMEDALRRGVAAAAIVCERQGAQPPTAAEGDALLGTATAG